jgi:hypothetical protein
MQCSFIQHQKIISFIRGIADDFSADIFVFKLKQCILVIIGMGICLVKCIPEIRMKVGIIVSKDLVCPLKRKVF